MKKFPLMAISAFSVVGGNPVFCKQNQEISSTYIPGHVLNSIDNTTVQSDSLFVYICQVQDANNATIKIDQQLDKFFQDLKCFANTWDFDVQGFAPEIDGLRKDIFHISRSDKMLPVSESRHKKITFARHMFQTMVNAFDIWTHYHVPKDPADNLLYNVIELRVKLLAFHDTEGLPDQKMTSRNMYTLYRLWHNLSFWKSIFYVLPDVPIDTRVIFASQARRAKKTIKQLLGRTQVVSK